METVHTEIMEKLQKSVLEYDKKGAAQWAKQAIEENMDPIKTLDALTAAIRQVGEGFGKGELFLPDLVGAADAMQEATPIIEQEIRRKELAHESSGTIVIGTVYGDIHTIGKTMVATLLTAEGFTVHDLGVNIKAEEFIEAIKNYRADILAMSALMTTTAAEQKKVIDLLKKQNMRDPVKVMVGGGAITQEFADSIGADGYEPTAPGAAILAKSLMAQ